MRKRGAVFVDRGPVESQKGPVDKEKGKRKEHFRKNFLFWELGNGNSAYEMLPSEEGL